MALSKNQQKVKKIIEKNYNTFISGTEGSGKTFLLRDLFKEFEEQEIK